MSPLVSILIPCYNAERWIAQAIESSLAQTWPEKEVIVVDDGSTDSSIDVIHQYDGRIRCEAGPNRGGNVTRNRLMELARGEWLQYLDADDYLLPEKVKTQVEFAREHPGVEVIYSPVAWKRIERGAVVCSESPIPEPRDPWILLALWRLPQTGGALWKKTALESVGGWRVGQPCCQEHELYCRLLENNARFEYCPGAFAVYRDTESSGRVTCNSQGEFERQRLHILDRIETYLGGCSNLTPARCQAVNDARHELARKLWETNRQFAMNTYKRILTSDRSFLPSVTSASPPVYLISFRAFGFRATQIVASLTRGLRTKISKLTEQRLSFSWLGRR
jgi:glycosyltransferase involved in cell wall biosynthesis